MSGIALETFNPVVFDDPVYCEGDPTSKFYKHCISFDDAQEKCFLFGVELEGDDDLLRFKKCQECKDHFQKAIEAKKTETDHRTQHQKQMDKHFIE